MAKLKQTNEPMTHVAVYACKKTNNRVYVTNVESLDCGTRIYFVRVLGGNPHITGRNNFKKNYYNVAGLIV